MKFISITLLFLFVFMPSLKAQITVTTTPASPSSGNSLRVKPTLAFSDPIESFNGDDILTSGAGENQVLVNDLLSFQSNGVNIVFTATINSDDDLIIIEPNEVLLPQTTYNIELASIRKKETDNDTLPASTYTFTTGKAVTVAIDTTSNICIGDPEGLIVNDIVITENLKDNFFSTSNNQEHRLILEVDEGFEFIEEGTLDLEDDTDISDESIEIVAGNSRQLLIKYKLCTDAPCSPSSANEDKITIKDVKVRTRATNTPVAGNTYNIQRVDAATNNAVMPGLAAGTVFARLQVIESPTINLTNLGTGQAITDEIVLCPNGDDFAINAEIEDPTNAVTYQLSRTQVPTDFVELGLDTLQIINEAIISTILFASEDVVYPVYLKASVSGSLCDGFSPLISITKDDGTSTPNATFSTNFPAENTTVTPGVSQDEFIVAVDNPGGILNIYCRGACLTQHLECRLEDI